MAIIGVHSLLYTTEPDALRAVFRDVFKWPAVDAGDGWLIFATPPGELGIHPAESQDRGRAMRHQFTLMCDDITQTLAELREQGIVGRGEPVDEGFGITIVLELPGGVEVLLYEPRHASPLLPA